MASSPAAWRPLGRRASGSRLGGALLLAALLAAAIVLELLSTCFASWTVRHPLTVTALVGLAVVALTVVGLDHVITTREGHHWRLPTLLAIDTYIYSADRAARRIYARVEETAKEVAPSPGPAGPLRFAILLELIILGDRDRLGVLSDLVRQEADELNAAATGVGSVAARSDLFAGDARRIFDEQDRLGRLAESLNGLRFLGGLGGPSDKAFRRLVTKNAEEAEGILRAFLDELANLRIAVSEARDD